MNPFQPLYDACNTGHPLGKYSKLSDFPRIIDVELTSACNYRCLMCPTGNLSLKRPAGMMATETMLSVIRQCPPGTGVRFIGWGEPTMHPKIIAFVDAAHDQKLLTHLNTNGSLMTPALMAGLIYGGLTSIKFSFQGVDRQSYLEMRNTDGFDQLVDTMGAFHRMRGNRIAPFIQVSTSTTYETPEQVAAFREIFAPISDQVSVGKTIFDFLDLKAVRLKPEDRERLEKLSKLASGTKAHPDPCPEVFDKLTVHYDGSVRVCCNDYDGVTNLGNVNEAPLREIWRHEQIEMYRKHLARHEYQGPLCSVCYHYMEGTA